MEFRNLTPFPALAFAGIDQRQQPFHVVVLRQTLSWDAQGQLRYAEEQAPLCEADECFGEMNHSSVRQESDLCHYKPKCDVIVNARGYAPGAIPAARFEVRLRVLRPGAVELPPRPYGLNQLQPPSATALQAWQAEVERLRAGIPLIDKSLTVSGPRAFERRPGVIGTLKNLLRSLAGLPRELHTGWQLTEPTPIRQLALCYEYAYGGQCRIDHADVEGARVPAADRLSEVQRAQHPDGSLPPDQQPIAHGSCAANPVGRGFVTAWYLAACEPERIPAPQVEYCTHPVTVEQFAQALTSHPEDIEAAQWIAGFGVRSKAHPQRAALAGTIDERFINSQAPLPADFDFAVWNCAPPDQQIDFLQGDEVIELTNLCKPDTPGARRDARGNTVLRFSLPAFQPYLLLRFISGRLAPMPLTIDTLIVEPDAGTVSIVYRATLPAQEPIRQVEARQMSRAQWQAALALHAAHAPHEVIPS